jgi:hypothetical protein
MAKKTKSGNMASMPSGVHGLSSRDGAIAIGFLFVGAFFLVMAYNTWPLLVITLLVFGLAIWFFAMGFSKIGFGEDGMFGCCCCCDCDVDGKK